MDEYTDDQIEEWTREDLLNSPILSDEEIEQLRNQKKSLTEYGREKLRKLMSKDIQQPNGDFLKNYPEVTRVEVITNNGREFVQYKCSNVQVSLQDDGRTLKVFLLMTNIIWENTLDERYMCSVTRNSQYSGQLKIFDTKLNKVLCDEEVRLSYGAAFGPDVADVNLWEERIIEIVDGVPNELPRH